MQGLPPLLSVSPMKRSEVFYNNARIVKFVGLPLLLQVHPVRTLSGQPFTC